MMIMTNKMGWPSEHTRGYQIAEALGCKVNTPVEDCDETIVAVKCYFDQKIQADLRALRNIYLDLIDDQNLVAIANRFPENRRIVLTDLMRDYLSDKVENEIVVIPEHSCNFAQETRPNSAVSTVGYVGSSQCFDLDVNRVREVLEQIGLDFRFLICETDRVTRKDVVEFYKMIDIQLAFRLPTREIRPPVFRNPLKIFNAGSFGIPTVAYPEISYRLEAGSYFLEALDLADVVNQCWMLKNDQSYYDFYSNRVLKWSQQFDIEQIAKLYAKLAPTESFSIEENVKRMRGAA